MPLDSARICEIIEEGLPSQKPKGSIPTLVGFESAYGVRRYVFTDIPEKDFRAMWERCEAEGGADPELFMKLLFERQGVSPRIVRTVSFVDI